MFLIRWMNNFHRMFFIKRKQIKMRAAKPKTPPDILNHSMPWSLLIFSQDDESSNEWVIHHNIITEA
jgi:hypothetical protein